MPTTLCIEIFVKDDISRSILTKDKPMSMDALIKVTDTMKEAIGRKLAL